MNEEFNNIINNNTGSSSGRRKREKKKLIKKKENNIMEFDLKEGQRGIQTEKIIWLYPKSPAEKTKKISRKANNPNREKMIILPKILLSIFSFLIIIS